MTLKGVKAVTMRYFTEFGKCVATEGKEKEGERGEERKEREKWEGREGKGKENGRQMGGKGKGYGRVLH